MQRLQVEAITTIEIFQLKQAMAGELSATPALTIVGAIQSLFALGPLSSAVLFLLLRFACGRKRRKS